jgi:ubiquinone/menaquinone biosynthesis C-methylase UbiE
MSKKHKETVRKYFTQTAAAFSKFAVRDTADVLAEKVEFVKPQATDVVLDVACGPGAFVLAIAPRVAFARGIDLTMEMLRQAREFQFGRMLSNVAFDCGEAEQLPYPDASFDIVSCQHALHHVQKPELVLKEMRRVAKPTARLLVIDTLSPEMDSKFEMLNQIEIRRDPSHVSTLRLTTFLKMFDDLGLETTRQAVRKRPRSFDQWMKRAGLEPGSKRYQETRRLMESSIEKNKAGLAPQPQGGDLLFHHNEGMFLVVRKEEENPQ